jgi:hypothetical protein
MKSALLKGPWQPWQTVEIKSIPQNLYWTKVPNVPQGNEAMKHSTPIIQPKTTYPPVKDVTTFLGFVVKGVLDVSILKNAAEQLITQWPIQGEH